MKSIERQLIEIATKPRMDFETADRSILYTSSTERMGRLKWLIGEMEQSDWWRLLSKYITSCDDCWRESSFIKNIFKKATPTQILFMRNKKALKKISQLPSQVEVYRGGYDINKCGFSWSLNKEVAKKFAGGYNRYKIANLPPKVFVGKIKRERIVTYTNERKEEEIISAYVRIIREEDLSGIRLCSADVVE